MSKEATVFILDINPNMALPFDDGSDKASTIQHSYLDAAKHFVSQTLSSQLFFPKSNEFALIALSTLETSNPLNDQAEENYQSISLLKPLMRANLDHLTQISQLSTDQGGDRGDVIDSILVAMQMLHERVGKAKFTKRIWLFTDGSNPSINDPEQLAQIGNGLKTNDYKLNVVGVNFKDDPDQDVSGTNRTQVQLANEQLLDDLCDLCGGSIVSLSAAMEQLDPVHKTVNQVTKFRGPLQIGDISIQVYDYGKTMVAPLPTMKKEVRKAGSRRGDDDQEMNDGGEEGDENMGGGDVKQQRTYWNARAESGRVEVGADERVRGFHYGLELVPFTEDQLIASKPQHEKCMVVLAFVPRAAVKRYQFMAGVDCIVGAPGDLDAGYALSAFIHALEVCQEVALVRCVKRANDRPTLGVLTPHVSASLECLWLNQLPFAEDIRDFNFPSIDANPKMVPNDSQRAAARDLINNMDLMMPEGELLKPEDTWNPAAQRFYDNIRRRAIDPACEIVALDSAFAKAVQVNPAVLEGAKPYLESFKQHFPLEPVPESKQTKKRSWLDHVDTAPNSDIDAINQALQQSSDSSNSASADLNLSSAVHNTVTKIGSVRPIEDFEAMLADRSNANNVDKAMKQMGEQIILMVRESFGDALFDKARDCMIAMRKAGVQHGEAHAFNQFLVNEIKGTAQRIKPKFYEWISANPLIKPIDSNEVEDSEFTPEESNQFFAKSSQPLTEESIAESSAEVDEFDEMD